MVDKNNIKAIILAGGQGIRLKDFVKEVPKPMLQIGQKSIIEHQIDLLIKYGINEFYILVNNLEEIIKNKFDDGSTYGIKISYIEEKTPLGTAGGLKEIEANLDDDFLVIYGNVLFNIYIPALIEFHQTNKSKFTIVLHPDESPLNYDIVEINNENKVIKYYNKPYSTDFVFRNLVNSGIYIISPDILKYIKKGEKQDFGKDIIPSIIEKKINIYGYVTSEYIKEINTKERWEMVNKDYKRGIVYKKNYENLQKAIFLDRDGVVTIEKGFVCDEKDLEIYDFTFEAIKLINRSEYLGIIVTNQSAVGRNLCTIEDIEKVHKRLETELGKSDAYFDGIYYCPHYPVIENDVKKNEFNIKCDCRKPEPGLIIRASKEKNIDLTNSYMIGDSERDIQAGKNAGCITVGVMTGYGLRQSKVKPDYFFSDLLEAVQFIINDPFKDKYMKIIDNIKNLRKKPVIISIAGNSKSGKSNFASYLKQKFVEEGYSVLRINLDDWILPEEYMNKTYNLYERYQSSKIVTEIPRILSGEEITLEKYSENNNSKEFIFYKWNNEDIVIIDGIIALGLMEIRKVSDIKIFIDIDETILQERLLKYYKWKSKNAEEINNIIAQLQKEEFPLVIKDRSYADMVINMG